MDCAAQLQPVEDAGMFQVVLDTGACRISGTVRSRELFFFLAHCCRAAPALLHPVNGWTNWDRTRAAESTTSRLHCTFSTMCCRMTVVVSHCVQILHEAIFSKLNLVAMGGSGGGEWNGSDFYQDSDGGFPFAGEHYGIAGTPVPSRSIEGWYPGEWYLNPSVYVDMLRRAKLSQMRKCTHISPQRSRQSNHCYHNRHWRATQQLR